MCTCLYVQIRDEFKEEAVNKYTDCFDQIRTKPSFDLKVSTAIVDKIIQ
jgi:hypothetical protein